MSLTRDQWYQKFKNWIPQGFFGTELHQKAVLTGCAQMAADRQLEADEHVTESTIGGGSGLTLDARGEERSIVRIAGESDSSYRIRLRKLGSGAAKPDLQALIDAILVEGTATIIEHEYDGPFLNRELYLDRGQIFSGDLIYNTFSIIVEPQLRDPETFLDREFFASRGAYMGSTQSLSAVLMAVVEAVQRNKLAGTMFRLVELKAA